VQKRKNAILSQIINQIREAVMKENRYGIIAGSVALLALTGVMLAAKGFRRSGKNYIRKFDPASVEELNGRVEDLVYSGRENGENRGVELILKSEDHFIPVHLGPAWFIERQKGRLKRGEKVQVRGSRILFNLEPIIVAETVTKGDKVLRLRYQTGSPVWKAWTERHK
jgi:hypothetical protein